MLKFFNSKKIKIILVWLVFLFLIFSSLSQTLATQPGEETLNVLKDVAEQAGLPQYPDPIMIIVNILNYLLTFIGVIFILIIIYGGLMWMTGGVTDFLWIAGPSHEEKIKKAKELIRDAIIGLVIIILARVIYYFVIERLKGEEHEAIIR